MRATVYYPERGRLRPGDLIFEGDQPILVVSWRTVDAKREPHVCFPLDPNHLKPLVHREGEYLYGRAPGVKTPRP
jgi:hypothetical protein